MRILNNHENSIKILKENFENRRRTICSAHQKPINSKFSYAMSCPRVQHTGAETAIVVSNGMRIYGLRAQGGRGGSGIVFTQEPNKDTTNMAHALFFEFPRLWILFDEFEGKSTQAAPRPEYKIDASHMFIGYDSIVQGLENFALISL